MATQKQLHDALADLQSENHRLRSENEAMRSALLRIYVDTRGVLGIEAAAQEREDARQRALNQLEKT